MPEGVRAGRVISGAQSPETGMSWMLASPRRNVLLLSVVALGAVAALAISAIAVASRQQTAVVDRQVRTTAAVSAVVIGEQTSNLVALVQSYAGLPSLAGGLAHGRLGTPGVEADLAGLAHAVPGISATFVADQHGTSLLTYPAEPAVYGANFAYREWFKGLVASGRPFVANAIQTKEASHALAITVTDYIRAPGGKPIGVLGVNYSLASIGAFAAGVGRAQGITLDVTDRAGTSLTAGGRNGLVSLAAEPAVRAALAGHSGLLEHSLQLTDRRRGPELLSAYAPVSATGWAVTASVNKGVALAGLTRLRDVVLAITALLVLILLATIRIVARSDERQRDSEREIADRDRDLARILESTSEAFLSTDGEDRITAWSGQAERLFGWTAEEVLGRSLAETVIPAAAPGEHPMERAHEQAAAESAPFGSRIEAVGLHRDGHEISVELSSWPNSDGDGLSAFAHDITERVAVQAELEELHDSLRLLAEHDPLTGLWNRRRFEEELHREVSRCQRYGQRSAVLMIDLDGFKQVNDSHGHQAGDELLKLVASRIRAALRESDSVARIGGDEFAVILPNIAPEAVRHVADKVRGVIGASRLTRNGATVAVTASIGSDMLDEKDSDQMAAMAKADAAMYRVKAAAGR
jgi:diguanylate cyclase (GGDEF)-like protein/PAS domain S-box-containing protein